MKTTIGVLAHVDSGKTTFSEQLLYHAGVLKAPGRVDRGDTLMDSDPLERARGITIFADQSPFTFGENLYYLMDTPGHVDFSAETERAVMALDAAVLLIAAGAGVTAHTVTLWRLLERYGVPTFLFFNKMDLERADSQALLSQVRERLSGDAVLIEPGDEGLLFSDRDTAGEKCGKYRGKPEEKAEEAEEGEESGREDGGADIAGQGAGGLAEFICERDETLLEKYLDESVTPQEILSGMRALVRKRKVFPCMCGSALRDQGVLECFRVMDQLLDDGRQEERERLAFRGLVYKIRHDGRQNRITFLKVLQGKLRVRDELRFVCGDGEAAAGREPFLSEKINEIRSYSGSKYTPIKEASAGELCAVTGLSEPVCGCIIGEGQEWKKAGDFSLLPALAARAVPAESLHLEEIKGSGGTLEERKYADKTGVPELETDENSPEMRRIISCMKILEAEEPQLRVSLSPLTISVMGEIQLEVIKQMFEERWGIEIAFLPPRVCYTETIRKPVTGYGHYEPLRHYAEAVLRLEPGERGSGIRFYSECHVDELAQNYQNLIRTHVFERVHRGILTGAPLTDVTIVLVAGRAHQKHTEGGDFREAVYRAVRQGLEKADNLLLEPYYDFEIIAESRLAGRILADIKKRSGEVLLTEHLGDTAVLRGRGPVSEFMNYPSELSSLTRGEGSISMVNGGYDVCHNQEEVIRDTAYDKGADRENTSSSVFCSHGAGFLVTWDKAEEYMHCLRR